MSRAGTERDGISLYGPNFASRPLRQFHCPLPSLFLTPHPSHLSLLTTHTSHFSPLTRHSSDLITPPSTGTSASNTSTDSPPPVLEPSSIDPSLEPTQEEMERERLMAKAEQVIPYNGFLSRRKLSRISRFCGDSRSEGFLRENLFSNN